MTRLLELIVALILVFILAVVVGVLLPNHGHVERTIQIHHNLQHVNDVLNNFRRFPDYSVLRSYEPDTTFDISGAPFGVGARISWQGTNSKVGTGALEITSSKPDQLVWSLDNDWKGHNKHFTIDLSRSDSQKLVDIRWSYDVDYGWNLIDRYSQLFLHGDPASFIQYAEDNLQSLLANIPNVGYAQLRPRLVDRPAQPVLLVSTNAPRNLDAIAAATQEAIDNIHAAMKKLDVKAVGTPITITTNWGDQDYSFDVAIPINQSTLTVAKVSHDLTQLPKPMSFAEQNLANAGTAPTAPASSQTAPASSAPSSGASAPLPAVPGTEKPGQVTTDGMLVINQNVSAMMAFGGRALAADWEGSPAGLPLVRLGLKAYASTHGYDFNEYVNRFYDIVDVQADQAKADQAKADETNADQDVAGYSTFTVYLPVENAPQQTPDQAASTGLSPAPVGSVAPPPAASGSAAPASSSAVPQDAASSQ